MHHSLISESPKTEKYMYGMLFIYLENADSAIRCQKTANICHTSALVTHTTSLLGFNKQTNY